MAVGITISDIRRMSSEECKSDKEIAEFYGLSAKAIADIRREYKIEKKRVYPKKYFIIDEETQPTDNQEMSAADTSEEVSTGEEKDSWL